MKKIILFFIFSCFIFSSTLFAQSQEEICRKANISYENADYEKAASLYEDLLEKDMVSPEVFYNLGNSFFKLKQIGRAIVNYERAQRLAPRDKDIRLNLKLARSMTVDKIEMPERGFIVKLVLFPYEMMSVDELTAVSSLIFLAIISILIFSIFFIQKRVSLFYSAGTLAILLIIFSIFLVSKLRAEVFTRHAVIISKKVDVRSGPKKDYLLQFTLHEGTGLRIVEERQGWYEIDLSRDLKGWLPNDSVEVI